MTSVASTTLYLEDLTRLVRTKVIECDCGCWYWIGAVNHHGYPRFELRGQSWLVHRYAYERLIAPIDDEMTLDHRTCTSHRCIRPDHMDVITRSENSTRANATRWHDMKYDADGNEVQRVVCPDCAKRDGAIKPPGNPNWMSPARLHAIYGAEADDAVGLDA